MSQQQLAQAARCSIAYVRLLEGGFVPSESDVMPRIEQALNNYDPGANRAAVKEGEDAAQVTT